MSDTPTSTPTPTPPTPEPSTPAVTRQPDFELPDDYGSVLLDRFGEAPSTGLTPDDGGVGVDAYALLGATRPAPKLPVETKVASGSEIETVETVETPEAPEAPEAPDGAVPVPPDEQTAPPESPDQTQPEIPSTSDWVWSGTNPDTGEAVTRNYSETEVITGLWLKAWSDSLPDDLRVALAAVENGQAIPISRADFDAWQAWQAQQRTTTRDSDLDQYESDAATEIRRLRDENARLQTTSVPEPQAQAQPTAAANLTVWTNEIDQAVLAYGIEKNLTDDERTYLWQQTVRSGVIPYIANNQAVFSPTGQLIAPANPRSVAREALEITLARSPQLASQIATRVSTSALPTTPPVTAEPSAQDQAVKAKKARAASHATAPSNAAAPVPRQIAGLAQSEIVNLIAADLRADPAFANGDGG